MQPILDGNRNWLNHDSGVEKHLICESSEHPERVPVIATLMQYESEVGVTVRPGLSTCAGAE